MIQASILIVDDDEELRKTLRSILEDDGHLVETVKNGWQAIKISEKFLYDIALIDIKLPDMKGIDLLQKMNENHPDMIKIIVTGYPSLQNAVKAVNEGADGYVIKPLQVDELLEMIRKLLDKRAAGYAREWMVKSKAEFQRSSYEKQFKKPKGSIFTRMAEKS